MTTRSSAPKMERNFQKEIIYNKLLPYVDELDEESERFLSDIKGHLGQAVMLRDLEQGCLFVTSRLYRYINVYGLKFSKEDHLLFIKLMYELITIPDLEPFLVLHFGNTLLSLIKKKELISPKELELPWRPLYETACRLRTSNSIALGMYRTLPELDQILGILINIVKVYFPLSATQEILDELKHTLCPLDGATMSKSLEYMEWFLPLQLPPEHHALGYQLWFDEFMSIWGTCHNAPVWEDQMLILIAELAHHNIGYINWEPHLPIMFTRFVRCLNLPVSYKHTHNIKHHKIDVAYVAKWIVAVLGNGSKAQTYLEKFLKSIETYFHPANSGQWLAKLRDLLSNLPYRFILRLHRERYRKLTWETPVPDNYKLTDDDVTAFVKSMMPIAITTMFSRLRGSDSLRHLATMRPNLVIPDVLQRMYSTLDSLTEPHKLTAAMTCMVAVARPMVQGPRNMIKEYSYVEGPQHVLPLLFSTLPGIDPNDAYKCCTSFHLISVYAILVPIVDCSRSTTEMNDEERMMCEMTSRFEDFTVQFFDRVFLLIDSSSLEFVRHENHLGNGKSKQETLAEASLYSGCSAVLIQTSDAIFKTALHKLRTFVTEHILEMNVAGRLAAVVCRSFAQVNRQDTLQTLVPVLSQTILDVINEGEGVIKEENLDNRLLYAMLLLSEIVEAPGDNLLPHIQTLLGVLDKVLLLKSKEGNNIACHILKYVLLSLSSVKPCQYKASERGYNDPEYPYIRDWGQPVDIDTLKIKWYIPGKEEIDTIQDIFCRYLLPEIDKLQKYCEDFNTLTRKDLLISLTIVCNIIEGCDSLLPIWEEPPLNISKSSFNWPPFLPTTGVKGKLCMPDGSNVRQYMVKIMSQVQKTILKNSEDDTKSLFALIRIWNSLLLNKICLQESNEIRRKKFQYMKRILGDRLIGNKGCLGIITLERVDIQHQTRIQLQSHALTSTHQDIILELFTLCISRYADIRAKAQVSLLYTMQRFRHSYIAITPHLIDILKKDTEEHHDAFKGVLYILVGSPQDPLIVKRNWSFIKSLWPALVLSKPSVKLSVIQLQEKIMDYVQKHFLTTAMSHNVPDRCLTAASALWTSKPYPIVQQPDAEQIEISLERLRKSSETNMEAYNTLLDELLNAILEKNMHWRHRLMAMSFIKNMVHPEQAYPTKVARYFLGALIHNSIQEREIAIRIVMFMLKQQKRKHPKVTINAPTIGKVTFHKEQGTNLKPGQRADNAWVQYNYETRPLTAEQWDECRYIHQQYMGYYVWPQKLEIYAPSSEQPTFDTDVWKLTDLEKEVVLFFNDSENVTKLISFLSLEGKKGKEKFSEPRFLLFKNLFRNYGIAILKNFVPHLEKLVADKQESSQKCVAEITAGIIRGAKHWPFQMTCDMWDIMLPIIRTALSNLTVETVANWGVCFASAQHHRDPNRHHWFLECLMEEHRLGESETSFAECSRLYALQSALNQQSWRVTQLYQRLLSRLEDRLLSSPFEIVRERLGSLLVTIFDTDLRFDKTSPSGHSKVEYLIKKVSPKLKQLSENITTANKIDKGFNETTAQSPKNCKQGGSLHMDNMFENPATSSNLIGESQGTTSRLHIAQTSSSKLAELKDGEIKIDNVIRVTEKATTLNENMTKEAPHLSLHISKITFDGIESTKLESEKREANIRLFKTICKWIIGTISRSQYGVLPEFYEFFPFLCQLENYEVDKELVRICSNTLGILAQAFTLPRDMPTALDAVTKVSNSSSWWARATSLEYLQVLIFHNMSIVLSNDSWVICVKDIVLRLLEDERLEVRDKAGQVLGGLLHCTFIPEQEKLLKQFKVKARTKLSKREHSVSQKQSTEKTAAIDAMRIRHAGVLGLCAFIRAHPYNIPTYVPSILEHLGIHLNDPQPIPTTIRRTLCDFKRTHYDGWTGMSGHAQNFTEQQLAILQDLTVPPAHYS